MKLDTFALIIDGCSEGEIYLFSIYATFTFLTGQNGYDDKSLSFSPLEGGTEHSVRHHMEQIKYVLSLFGKALSNVVTFIADKCATDRLISRLTNVQFIGWCSHRYNLAVKDIIESSIDILTKVKILMSFLIYHIRRAKLRNLAHFAPLKCVDTIWSSVDSMMKQYISIREHFKNLDIDDLDDLLLSKKEEQ